MTAQYRFLSLIHADDAAEHSRAEPSPPWRRPGVPIRPSRRRPSRGSSTTSRTPVRRRYRLECSTVRRWTAARPTPSSRTRFPAAGRFRTISPRGFPVIGSRLKVVVWKKGAGYSIATVDPFGELLSIDSVSGQCSSGLPPARALTRRDPAGLVLAADILQPGHGRRQCGSRRSTFDSLAAPVRGRGAGPGMVSRLAYVTWHSLPRLLRTPRWTSVLWTRRLSDGFARPMPVATLDVVPRLVGLVPGRSVADGEVRRRDTPAPDRRHRADPSGVLWFDDLVAVKLSVGAPRFPAGDCIRRPAPGAAPGWDCCAAGSGRGRAMVCFVAKLASARSLTRRPLPRTGTATGIPSASSPPSARPHRSPTPPSHRARTHRPGTWSPSACRPGWAPS